MGKIMIMISIILSMIVIIGVISLLFIVLAGIEDGWLLIILLLFIVGWLGRKG